jgi:hypothetical protein
MSKKTNKKAAKKDYEWIWLLTAAILILAAVLLVVWLLAGRNSVNTTKPTASQPSTNPVKIEGVDNVNIDIGSGMRIVDVAKYTGIYMEDGTNEVLSGLLMIVVKNEGTKDIQYAEVEMPVGDQTAYFKLSTLPAGESMVVLEKNRMAYTDGDYQTAISKNVAFFQAPLSLCKEKIVIQALNGTINITNVSGADITGDVVIYYKNSASDMLYGGVTYRCVISGGLKKGEIKQISASHFTANGSRVMFVTCG